MTDRTGGQRLRQALACDLRVAGKKIVLVALWQECTKLVHGRLVLPVERKTKQIDRQIFAEGAEELRSARSTLWTIC